MGLLSVFERVQFPQPRCFKDCAQAGVADERMLECREVRAQALNLREHLANVAADERLVPIIASGGDLPIEKLAV